MMRLAEFQTWLQQRNSHKCAAQSDVRSRCKRVEDAEGDLDQHYVTDQLATLLERLKYSVADERSGAPVRHSIPMSMGIDVRNGTSSLANAIRLYRQFCVESPS